MWRLWTYEVWASELGGYHVNDRFDKGIVDLPVEPTDDEIIAALVRPNIHRSAINIHGDDSAIYLDIDGNPACEIIKE